MSSLPPPVAARFDGWVAEHLAPAWLEIDGTGRIVAAGGDLARYGLDGVTAGDDALDHVPAIDGQEPPLVLSCIAFGPDVHGDLHLFEAEGSTWVLLLDATAPARQRQEMQQRGNELALARDELDKLVRTMVPPSIAKRLRAGERAIAEDVAEATVLFTDIHDFSRLTAGLEATEVVSLLNGVFSAFDELADRHGLVRIKTSGDTYECVAGAPDPRDDHAHAAAELALDMQKAITRFSTPSGRTPSLRIGMHSGPIVAGVIGTHRLAYDIWGDAVRTASHMEAYGLPGRIQVTAATYAHLRAEYLLEERGEFYVGGQGDVVTYLLNGRRVPRT